MKRNMLYLIMAGVMLFFPITTASHCRFPEQWHGIWYRNSLGDVIIQENFISGIGSCMEEYNDYYMMKPNRQEDSACFICMLIIQKHPNIIQYRESYCLKNVASAKSCRWHLPVEQPLHTLVKENAHPVDCPFSDAYSFKYRNNTYNMNARAFCERPSSVMKPCARTSKFHFRFRHCRGLEDSHEKELDFQCLATWKDGSDKFLYGGFSGSDITRNEDMYRCFKYETDGTPAANIQLAMSADASCQGLSSATDGPVIMVFTRDVHSWDRPRCQFPEWLRQHNWRDLSGRHVYASDQTGKIWNINFRRHGHGKGHVTFALRCNSVFQDDASNFVAVTFTSDDCNSYYQCIRIRRIKDNVIEFSQGPPNTYQIDFCSPDVNYEYKNILFHEDISHTDCPFPGRLESVGVVTTDIDVMSCSAKINNGCNGSHVMQIESECVERTEKRRMECLSDWQEDGRHFVIVRQLGDVHPYNMAGPSYGLANCFVYEYEGSHLRIQTDLQCNIGARDIMGRALEAVLDGHTSPCQRQDVWKLSPPSHRRNSCAVSRPTTLTTLISLISLIVLGVSR